MMSKALTPEELAKQRGNPRVARLIVAPGMFEAIQKLPPGETLSNLGHITIVRSDFVPEGYAWLMDYKGHIFGVIGPPEETE